jgi:hypothetical protein
MRPTDFVADVAGVLLLTTAAALPLSCTPRLPAVESPNLQPLVATAGAYGIAEAAAATPAPVPTVGCEAGCKCNGTGKEPSGDGLSIVGCRCPDSCSCKAKKAATTEGRPGWPPRPATAH